VPLARARNDQWAMMEAIKASDHEKVVQLCQEHGVCRQTRTLRH
jgi:hypothetical protein